MARRRRRATKRRTRRSTGFNIKNAAFAWGATVIATKAVTGLGPYDFLTAGTPLNRKGISMAGHWSGQDAGGHRQMITLKEIMAGANLLNDGSTAQGINLAQSLTNNLMNNGFQMIVGLVTLKAADKILTRTGVWRNTNKILKGIGIKNMVRV